MYAYGKVKGIGEVDGPVHRIYRTVSDVEQGGCVVEAQVPRKQYKDFFKCSSYDSSKIFAGEYLGFHTLLKPQLDKGFQVLSSSFLLPSLLFFQKTGPIFLLLKLETKKFCCYICQHFYSKENTEHVCLQQIIVCTVML